MRRRIRAGRGGARRPGVRSIAATALGCAFAVMVAGCGGKELLYEGRGDLSIEPLEVRLVRISDAGVVPGGVIRMPLDSGGIAFINDTGSRLVSIVFPGRALDKLRCSTTQNFESDGESTFTREPLAPGGAASLCLHTVGALPFEVHGVGAKPFKGTVEVVDYAKKDHDKLQGHEAPQAGGAETPAGGPANVEEKGSGGED